MWEANSCIWSSSSVEWIWKEKERHTFVRMLSIIHCVKWNCWNEIESIISEPCLLGYSDSKLQKIQKIKMVVHIVMYAAVFTSLLCSLIFNNIVAARMLPLKNSYIKRSEIVNLPSIYQSFSFIYLWWSSSEAK